VSHAEADGERIGEIPESSATGSVADVYADIRRVLGVPFVALIYRVLASEPDRLESIWSDLGPNLASEVARGAARTLAAPPPRPIVAGRAPDGLALDVVAAVATLEAFRHGNALGAIGLSALLQGVDGPRAPNRGPSAPRPFSNLLPMADLASLPGTTLDLLERMSAPVAGPERPIVIPSLFRYFAHDRRVLEFVWETIQPVVEDPAFFGATAAIRTAAGMAASSLPYRVRAAEDPETRRIADRFVTTIPAMIIVSRLIEDAISPR
jgi:hypothetical protein